LRVNCEVGLFKRSLDTSDIRTQWPGHFQLWPCRQAYKDCGRPETAVESRESRESSKLNGRRPALKVRTCVKEDRTHIDLAMHHHASIKDADKSSGLELKPAVCACSMACALLLCSTPQLFIKFRSPLFQNYTAGDVYMAKSPNIFIRLICTPFR
jgi:hypothetical protein